MVGVGTPDGGGMLGASRAVDARHIVPRPRGSGAGFIAGVNQAAAAGRYDVVFGGGDDWMAALSTYQSSISTSIAHPESEAVHAALDKMDLTKRARKAGLSAPHTESATDQAMAAWRGPVVVKCRAHWSDGQTRPLRIEARLFADIASARSQIDLIRDAGAQPVMQEPVRGGLSALIGIFHDGRLNGRVQQVSPRLWPTPNGASARATTVPVDDELASRAETLLTDLGWWGLVELQFLTGDDGRAQLIDLNGRFFGSMALSNTARPGLADAWGRLALGDPLPHLQDAPAGFKYAWLAGDIRRAGRERRGGLINDAAETLRWSRTAHHSVWDPRDPGPIWNLASSRLRRKAPAADESSAPPV